MRVIITVTTSREHHGASNHHKPDRLFHSLFRLTTRTSSEHYWPFVRGIPQRDRKATNVAMALHHYIYIYNMQIETDGPTDGLNHRDLRYIFTCSIWTKGVCTFIHTVARNVFFFHITETRNYEFRSVFYSYVIHGLLPEKSMVDEGWNWGFMNQGVATNVWVYSGFELFLHWSHRVNLRLGHASAFVVSSHWPDQQLLPKGFYRMKNEPHEIWIAIPHVPERPISSGHCLKVRDSTLNR